jgi:hypothetical protein
MVLDFVSMPGEIVDLQWVPHLCGRVHKLALLVPSWQANATRPASLSVVARLAVPWPM